MKRYVLALLSIGVGIGLLFKNNQLYMYRHLKSAETMKTPASLCKAMFWNDGVEPMTMSKEASWRKHECDQLFCRNSNTTDGNKSNHCQWSKFAIATLLENASRVCTAAQVEEFTLKDLKWNEYQLADFVKDLPTHKNLTTSFPGSLAAAIRPNESRAEGLTRVVAQRIKAQPPRFMNRTAVLHLRLGDVIDEALESVADMLYEQTYFYRSCNNRCCPGRPLEHPHNPPLKRSWNKYVKPLSFFSKLKDLDAYESLVLLGGAHNTIGNATLIQSCHYTTAVQAYLQRKIPKVTLRVGGLPDEDVLFAAQTPLLVPTGGGFSQLLAQLNGQMQARGEIS